MLSKIFSKKKTNFQKIKFGQKKKSKNFKTIRQRPKLLNTNKFFLLFSFEELQYDADAILSNIKRKIKTKKKKIANKILVKIIKFLFKIIYK